MPDRKVILVDYFRTICFDDFWASLDPKIAEKMSIIFDRSQKELCEAWVVGYLSSEEMNYILSKRIGLDPNHVWPLFVEDLGRLRIEQSILDKLNALRDRYVVAMTTDNMDCFDRFTVPSLGLMRYFDRIFNSSAMGMSKSWEDGCFFEHVYEELDVEPHQCMLLDDNAHVLSIFESGGGGFPCHVTEEKPVEDWLDEIAATT